MKSYNNEKGIVSLTSWKARINTVHITIENLLEKCPNWHIVLVLSEDEFPQKEEELPQNLKALFDKIEILWVKKNWKAFKKVVFTLRKYPNVPICTSDDDAFYECNYAEELYQKWIETGMKKCCINYVDIPQITFLGPCMLYYGIDFPVETLSEDEIRKTFDDPWMYNYAKKNRIPIFTCGHKRAPFVLHDDIRPLHPKFKSKFMQSIQHISSENVTEGTKLDTREHLVLVQYKYNGNSKEIISAVNSFKKHAQFKFKMFLLGDKCPWLEVPVIEGDKEDLTKYLCREQHIHVARDLKNAISIFKDSYDEFCLMSDDFFCINDFTWDDLKVPKYNSKRIDAFGTNKKYWNYSKMKTNQFLIKNRISTIDYTTHCFAVYEMDKLEKIIDEYDLTTPCNDYTIEDLYGNLYWPNAVDVNNYRTRFRKRQIVHIGMVEEAKKQGKLFMNFADGVNLDLLPYIDAC